MRILCLAESIIAKKVKKGYTPFWLIFNHRNGNIFPKLVHSGWISKINFVSDNRSRIKSEK